MDLVEAFTTTGSEADAQRLADLAVGAGLAACVRIDAVDSVYRWQGAVQREREWRLACKTAAAAEPLLREALLAAHPYALPAWHVLPVADASPAYARWVLGNCAGAALAGRLRAAVRALRLANTPDRWQAGAPLGLHPSLDLAVVAFPRGGPPVAANLLFSREHPQGHVAAWPIDFGALTSVRFERDLRDAAGTSRAWAPGADWAALPFVPLHGPPDGVRFVAPYPASLVKLMVAVGLGLAVDRGALPAWPAEAAPMITVSDNQATDACVAALHRAGLIVTAGGAPGANALNDAFAQHGLPTLRLDDTTPSGGWRNADGAGVGHLHMTAWDTVRLLWLLDPAAPPPPWRPAGAAPLLQPDSAAHLWALLRGQRLDEVLSSGSRRGRAGWRPGLPDAPAFAHKTGTTDNYASDAGVVDADGVRYGVAVLTTLGRRFAPDDQQATPWTLPALGAAVHAVVRELCAALDDPEMP